MTDTTKPHAVWIHHPPSGRTQQCSAQAWANRSTSRDESDSLTGWELADIGQAQRGAAVRIAGAEH